MIALFWLLSSGARAEGCDARAVTDAVVRAESAFIDMDGDTFASAVVAIGASLACQSEPLSAIQIAGVHRVKALGAFFDGDEPSAILAFQALLATMPGYELPLDIAPVGHPLRKTFDEAKLFSAPEPFVLPEPVEGWLSIDGRRGTIAPAARPFVLQRFDASGGVLETTYITVGSPVPAYPVRKGEAAPPLPVDREPKISRGLLAGGLLLATAGAISYGAAFPSRAAYDEAVRLGKEPQIRRMHAQTNILVGIGVGGLAGGAAITLVSVF